MAYDYFQAGQPRDVVLEHRRRLNAQIHARFLTRDTRDPLEMTVDEFVKLYRMPQHEVVRLCNIVRPYVPRRTSPQATPLITKMLAALNLYGGGSYQRKVGESAHSNVCQASVSRYVHEITDVLNHPEILSRFIHFPATREERLQLMQTNEERLGMPRVLGYIDGSLVRIVPPPVQFNRQAYYSRKHFTAINAQIICDANLNILNVNAAFPGSCHDFFVWNGTIAKDVMVHAYFHDRCWLLGDSGYFLAPWLHVPIPDAVRGTPEFDYTQLHCSARNCVERCIGVLKARWRCLCHERALTYRPIFAGKIINACCVLHNFCLSRGLPNPRPYIENVPIEPPHYNDLPLGMAARAAAEQRYLINYAHARKNLIVQRYQDL